MSLNVKFNRICAVAEGWIYQGCCIKGWTFAIKCSCWYKVQGTRYQVQGTRYKVHEISSDMKSRRTWNLKWHQISAPPHIYLNFFGILSFVTQVNSLPRTSSKPNKSEWVLLCQMSLTVDVHEMSNVECWMWNVHCSQLCTTVHNCSQIFTVHNCAQQTVQCSLFTTAHKCSKLCTTVRNCALFTSDHSSHMFTTVHRSQLTVHNCALFVCFLRTGVPIRQVLFVCLFVS